MGEGVSQRLTDEEFLSVFVFLKIRLQKLEVFAVLFRSRAEPAKRSIFGVAGGLRYRILQS